MNFDILITIIFTSIFQSIFGTGVLLFGTPILLILGNNFQTALIILLPVSVLINFFQISNNYKTIDQGFYKNLVLFCLPAVFLSLYFSHSSTININIIIGIFLIIISLQFNVGAIKGILKWLLQYEIFYLTIMGFLHGLTNLGGSLLSAGVLSKDLTKDSKRSTIAISYFSMGAIQIITLIATMSFYIFLNKNYFLYWATGPAIFFLVEKYLYYTIDEKMYKNISSIFLFIMGLILIMKS